MPLLRNAIIFVIFSDFELPSRITTHNMGVGTDPVATDSTTQKAIAKKKKKEKEKKSYVKVNFLITDLIVLICLQCFIKILLGEK